MVAIGQTHVILATYSGARFGFSLLWVILLAHILTYPVFEYGPRYAVATGGSLIDAYMRLPGLRVPMMLFFGLLLTTIPFIIVASLLSVTASILLAAWPQVPFNYWCVIVTVSHGGTGLRRPLPGTGSHLHRHVGRAGGGHRGGILPRASRSGTSALGRAHAGDSGRLARHTGGTDEDADRPGHVDHALGVGGEETRGMDSRRRAGESG